MSEPVQPPEPDAPRSFTVLLRIAGLSAHRLEPLRSPPCQALLQTIAAAESKLAELRADLVRHLYPAVPTAPPPLRRLLLAVRRDAFRGRPLASHSDAPHWAEVRRLSGPLTDRILQLEDQTTAARHELDFVYPREWERTTNHLRELLADRRLARGLALASPVLATQLGRLAADPDTGSRRERKLLLSGLRYASRAALKLSPYSTLTRLALGRTTATGPAIRFLSGEDDWQERSVVRLRRYLVEQLADAVAASPALHNHLPLALNPTLTRLGAELDRWALVRPAHWSPSPEGTGRRWIPPTPVEVPLAPALVAWLEEQLAAGDLGRNDLAARLAESLGNDSPPAAAAVSDRAAGSLDKLVRLGVLLTVPPWDAGAPRLEESLRDALAAGPPELAPVAQALADLIELEDNFAVAEDPAAYAAAIDAALDRAWHAAHPRDSRVQRSVAARAGGAKLEAGSPISPQTSSDSEASSGAGGDAAQIAATASDDDDPPIEEQAGELYRAKPGEVYEDLVLLGPGGGPAGPAASGTRGGELAVVNGDELREVLASLATWLRLSDLFSPHHELLHTLAAVMRQRWPGRRSVGALELFRETRGFWPAWREILAHPLVRPRDRAAFNPLQVPAVATLEQHRQEVWSGLTRLLAGDVAGEEPLRLDRSDLTGLLAGVPVDGPGAVPAPLVDPCLFLQPAGGGERLWVLNRLFEGTGRYASRAVTVLPADHRRALAAALTAASTVTLPAGGEADLLDLLSTQGDTLNVHVPQTRKILDLPGEGAALPADRRVRLADLSVRLGSGEAGSGPLLPELCDRTGRRLLPVHLGGAALAFMPHLTLFLAAFGPGELRPLPLPRQAWPRGPAEVLHRTVLDRVVLGRKRWLVPPAATAGLAAELRNLTPARALAAIDRWRRAHGLPEQLFVIERVSHPAVERIFKPQYLDLAAPPFCELFRVLIGKAVRRAPDGPTDLAFEEALPAPADLPRDTAGEPWAIEVQVEPLLLGRAGP